MRDLDVVMSASRIVRVGLFVGEAWVSLHTGCNCDAVKKSSLAEGVPSAGGDDFWRAAELYV
jgi:hypothetical protein